MSELVASTLPRLAQKALQDAQAQAQSESADATARAFDKLDSKLQAMRRAGEAAELHHGEEATELVQVHRPNDSKISPAYKVTYSLFIGILKF